MTNYSVITNFGCHWQCPYCIVKKTGLNVPKTDIPAVMNTLAALDDVEFLSFSGGGDPLFPVDKTTASGRTRFYRECCDWAHARGAFTEMHTSYFQCSTNVRQVLGVAAFDRIVYHMRPTRMDDVTALERPTRWHSEQKVRVVYVVTSDFTPERIDHITDIVESNPNIDELSFRQMVNPDNSIDHTCEDYLRSGHKHRWWYIEQDDYNTYIVNNRLYTRFSDIGKAA